MSRSFDSLFENGGRLRNTGCGSGEGPCLALSGKINMTNSSWKSISPASANRTQHRRMRTDKDKAKSGPRRSAPAVCDEAAAGLPEDIRDHIRLMCIIALGFQTDKTRGLAAVGPRPVRLYYPFLGVSKRSTAPPITTPRRTIKR
jgi:hypothetical protein